MQFFTHSHTRAPRPSCCALIAALTCALSLLLLCLLSLPCLSFAQPQTAHRLYPSVPPCQIRMLHRNIQCHLLVGGEPLRESTQKISDNVVEVYVPATEGATYEILCQNNEFPITLGVRLSASFIIDGRLLHSQKGLHLGKPVRFAGPRVNPTETRPFQFGRMKSSNDGDGDADSDNLATVKVKVYEVRLKKRARRLKFDQFDDVTTNERALKKGGHMRDSITT